MNKVQQINLGGVPFTIDEDAYEHLSRYLETIHRHFRQSEGYEEITRDIEARLAELFQEGMGQRQIVNLDDVKNAIVIMGTPEDFGADSIEEESASERFNRNYRTGRRLYRDPEEEVLGGVCAGIAAYTGISDPLWVRIAFILLTFTTGFGILAYIILWAIMPQARTASDRLAMRGEPINISTIGQIIEEEVEHFSQKVSELGGKKKGQAGTTDFGDILRHIVAFIGKVLRIVIDLIAKLWKPLLILVGILFVLAFIAIWVGAVGGGFYFWPYLDYFSPNYPVVTALGAFNVLIIIGMVLLQSALFVTRLLYGTRMSRNWRNGLTGFWALNVISLVSVVAVFSSDFRERVSITTQVPLSGFATDTLTLEMGAPYNGDVQFNLDDDFIFTGSEMLVKEVDIRVHKSEGSDFDLATEVSSRGASTEVAESYLSAVHYNATKMGDAIVLPPYFSMSEGAKWRIPEVNVEVKVPVGKFVKFDGDVRFRITDADKADYRPRISNADKADYRPRIYDNPGSTWEMTEDGLVCLDCQEQ